MAAAPKVATIQFKGASGRDYTYTLYISDVAAAFATWSTVGTAGTSSVTYITAPENMVITDISVPTGLTDTTSMTLWLDDAPLRNSIVAYSNIVNSLPTRNFPRIGIAGGRKVQFAQNA